MSTLLRFALIAPALILNATFSAADEETSPDEKAIQDAAVKFVDAYNTKDAEAITALFDPQAAQFKGIYFHYSTPQAGKEGHSQGFVPDQKFFETPDRTWMIRAYFTKD
jgi:hypothetical protein